MIAITNDEISKLLERLRTESEEHSQERAELQVEVNKLREKMYVV